jgi:mRNA interferase MazF
MAISYYPRAGAILMCDLSEFVAPEMDKIRPVMVISPRLPFRGEVVTIVPLSTTKPQHVYPYTVLLSRNYHPQEPEQPGVWAKCDMVLNVSRSRLDGFKVGRRKWVNPEASDADLQLVRTGVLHGLGFGNLL